MMPNVRSAPTWPKGPILAAVNASFQDKLRSEIHVKSVQGLDISKYGINEQSAEYQLQDLPAENEVQEWMVRPPALRAGVPPSSILRLLIGHQVAPSDELRPVPHGGSTAIAVENLANFLDVPLRLIERVRQRGSWFLKLPNSSQAFGTFQYSLTWSHQPGITVGFVIFYTSGSLAHDKFMSSLKALEGLIDQEGILPFVCAQTSITGISEGLDESQKESWDATFKMQGRGGPIKPATYLNEVNSRITGMYSSHRNLRTVLDLTRAALEDHDSGLPISSNKPPPTGSVLAWVGAVQREATVLLVDSEMVQRQTSQQLSNLLNTIAHRQAEASRSLAIEAKRDTSAMTTLALVTMFFLPGTAIASIFAMPLFDWSASSSAVVNPRLKIYFMVTIPLTIITTLAWWIWTQMKIRSRMKEEEKQRKEEAEYHGPMGLC